MCLGVDDMDNIEYKNRYKKNHYDRIELAVPKGQKEKIKEVASGIGMSVNEYLFQLFCDDLQTGESRLGKKKQGFNQEQLELLKKWQIRQKYHDMIEDLSHSKEDGYFICLKKGFINDATGSRIIRCKKTSEIRLLINKSHPVVEDKTNTDGLDSKTVAQLQKWQIPKMYYEMIEAIDPDEYVIRLKEGYINEKFSGRIIQVEKANTFRSVMKYTKKE